MLAGFLIAAAVIGLVADVLSPWPRIRPFFKKSSLMDIRTVLGEWTPITLDIGRNVVSAAQKNLTWLPGSKLHSLAGRAGTVFFLTDPVARQVTVLAFVKKI